MDAIITGESERIGLSVIDNNDVEHLIEMTESGEIKYHEQDGYSDYPSERTQEENEHVRQARRYAKWCVYRERGYETMPRHENPDCLVAAMIALSDMSEATVEDQFADIRRQIESHYDKSGVELPFEDAHPDDPLVYRADLYLDPQPQHEDTLLVDQYVDSATAIQEDATAVLTDADDLEHQLFELLNYEDRLATALPSFDVEAVSGMHTLHTDGTTERTTEVPSPLDRQPDARIELPPVDLRQFDLFQLLLVMNLSAQVRDRFLMMGVSPPEPFQHQGFGTYRGTVKQQINEMYDRHYLFSETTDKWGTTLF
ncbi:hypothetical protein G6M89_12275 [Natronolimnobius sp. AArcel1]|uniref:hypothetical protein n=1 Tax=Natronolimnobius sp. AArcel1 TaxID=1679093 RepID=UPI0013EB97BE|nr:hypothetical protein [Natronolimnobius sp. AArcel1]NGM69773.1 hypothetical protein [Natronolimnobius sp. AArcel1]